MEEQIKKAGIAYDALKAHLKNDLGYSELDIILTTFLVREVLVLLDASKTIPIAAKKFPEVLRSVANLLEAMRNE